MSIWLLSKSAWYRNKDIWIFKITSYYPDFPPQVWRRTRGCNYVRHRRHHRLHHFGASGQHSPSHDRAAPPPGS
nr:hypothetical protein GZ18F2_54 [uncultured archaeon GZfos18F2]